MSSFNWSEHSSTLICLPYFPCLHSTWPLRENSKEKRWVASFLFIFTVWMCVFKLKRTLWHPIVTWHSSCLLRLDAILRSIEWSCQWSDSGVGQQTPPFANCSNTPHFKTRTTQGFSDVALIWSELKWSWSSWEWKMIFAASRVTYAMFLCSLNIHDQTWIVSSISRHIVAWFTLLPSREGKCFRLFWDAMLACSTQILSISGTLCYYIHVAT